MASMVFAASPLSVQSLVKLRTNSNYPRSSCYVPSPSKAKNSYVPLSYKNISHSGLSKSSFIRGDGNFSFSLPKIPRVPSTLSPSLNIINQVASSDIENIYHFKVYNMRSKKYIHLGDEYKQMVLLIVNIPKQDSEWTNTEIKLLNGLRQRYLNKSPIKSVKGFEVLGFLHSKNELPDKSGYNFWRKTDILGTATFPIFGKVAINDDHKSFLGNIFMRDTIQKKKDEDLWYFLRHRSIGPKIIQEGFQKFVVDVEGVPRSHYPWFRGQTLQAQSKEPGKYPGSRSGDDPYTTIQNEIDKYFT